MFKKLIKLTLIKISRVIFWVTPSEFKAPIKRNKLLKEKLDEKLINETLTNFEENIKKSIIFTDRTLTREYAIKESLLNDESKEYYYLEFGVWKGNSSNAFSKFVKKLYCFDSFEGLKEDFVGTDKPKNTFSLNKRIPKLNSNVEPIVGWVEDTLDKFLKKHNPKINFVHLDMDTYSPTKFALKKIKPYLLSNSILIFDELYNYPGWKYGEYKALMEVFEENEFEYKGFNIYDAQVVIKVK